MDALLPGTTYLDDLWASAYDEHVNTLETVTKIRRLVEAGQLETLEPLLPLILNLKGKPYTLEDHFPFSPMFHTHIPKRAVYCTARQVSKTTSMGARGVVLSNIIPYFTSLYVTPRFEQIRRFSSLFVRPFIDLSPIKDLWSNTTTENSVLQRSFVNYSKMLFSFALLDADRIRGVTADMLCIDEVQDMDKDHIPIIREALSHSEWGIEQFTGTPKTLDNTINTLWKKSSMAEWFIRCHSCTTDGFPTWNIPSLEFHLEKMIGPYREDISEQSPGVICHKCGRPINPRNGRWVHRRPENRDLFSGYHIAQLLLPLHYSNPAKWAELLMKQEGGANTSPHVFINEVLGESSATGNQLITEPELIDASILPWVNDPRNPSPIMMENLKHYRCKVLGVDWGGGGEEQVSFTTLSLLGFRPDGSIDVLWGKRLLTPHDHPREANEIFSWFNYFRPDLIAHDYTGAGSLRETMLIQAGVPYERVMPMRYEASASRSLLNFIPATPLHQRNHYGLDKTRSLLYTLAAIKFSRQLGGIRFFQYDYKDESNPGLIRDFLALIDEKRDTSQRGDVYMIKRAEGFTDDFAQATNMAACAIWHSMDAWPNFALLAGTPGALPITIEQEFELGRNDAPWGPEDTMDGYFRGA